MTILNNIKNPFIDELQISDHSRESLKQSFVLLKQKNELLLDLWSERYLKSFGRETFMTTHRVKHVFENLTHVFLSCLKNFDMTDFIASLKKSGSEFSELGVPFEEVVLCIHLFQDSCLEILNHEDAEQVDKRIAWQGAYEELGRIGTAVIAVSFFYASKGQWEEMIESYRGENAQVRSALKDAEKDLYSKQNTRMASMEIALSNINRKLRDGARETRALHRFANSAHECPQVLSLFDLGHKAFRQSLGEDDEILFGELDSQGRKFRLYGLSPWKENNVADEAIQMRAEMIPEQLLLEHREMLFSESKKPLHQHNVLDSPNLIMPYSSLSVVKSYTMVPLRYFNNLTGFVWLASPNTNIELKAIKYFERLSKPLSASLYCLSVKEKNNRLSLLTSVNKNIETGAPIKLSADHSLDYYFSTIMELLGVERTSLMLLDKKRNLKTFAAKGFSVQPFSGLSLKWGEGIAGACVKESRIICVSRMHPSGKKQKPAKKNTLSLKSLACLPLEFNNVPIGVVNVSTINYYKDFNSDEINVAKDMISKLANILVSPNGNHYLHAQKIMNGNHT